jgi:triacylglycerol lipase
MRIGTRAMTAGLLAGCAILGAPSVAPAKEPLLTVARSKLAAALTCHGEIAPGRPRPIIVAPGTGSDGSQVYALGKGAFDVIGRPVCVISFPDRTTADVQVSVQYLVHAIRAVSRRARRPIAVAGVSQGGLLIRIALTYWPDLRAKVRDAVTAAATHHGTVAGADFGAICRRRGCPPAVWQQLAGSDFLRALNSGREETPGKTAWTTIRSATDEVVRPQTGPAPTSSLKGATNILIQDVCPGRRTAHLGVAVDSVTFAALTDAVIHRGAARVARFPRDVCAHPYGTGLDEQRTSTFLNIAPQLLRQGSAAVPRLRHEPTVRAWVKREH